MPPIGVKHSSHTIFHHKESSLVWGLPAALQNHTIFISNSEFNKWVENDLQRYHCFTIHIQLGSYHGEWVMWNSYHTRRDTLDWDSKIMIFLWYTSFSPVSHHKDHKSKYCLCLHKKSVGFQLYIEFQKQNFMFAFNQVKPSLEDAFNPKPLNYFFFLGGSVLSYWNMRNWQNEEDGKKCVHLFKALL